MPLEVYLNVAIGGVLTGLVYGLMALGLLAFVLALVHLAYLPVLLGAVGAVIVASRAALRPENTLHRQITAVLLHCNGHRRRVANERLDHLRPAAGNHLLRRPCATRHIHAAGALPRGIHGLLMGRGGLLGVDEGLRKIGLIFRGKRPFALIRRFLAL